MIGRPTITFEMRRKFLEGMRRHGGCTMELDGTVHWGPSVENLLKVELGGGSKPREGFINVDRCPTADRLCDFDASGELCGPSPGCWWGLPFRDDSVGHLYSAHCLEHVVKLWRLMREIVRICAIGATVEIVVPHWASSGAMLHGHVQTIPPCQAEQWSGSTPEALAYWWQGCAKRLKLLETDYAPGVAFGVWRDALPTMSQWSILEFCPDAAHEIRYFFSVVENS
jgi:hypothetical protein